VSTPAWAPLWPSVSCLPALTDCLTDVRRRTHARTRTDLTLGMGKIFHEGAQHHNQDANYSWSPEALYPDYLGTGEPGIYDPKGSTPGVTKGDLAHIMRNEDEPVIQDGLLTTHAVQIIQNLSRAADSAADRNASDPRPFFLAVGLHKPVRSPSGPRASLPACIVLSMQLVVVPLAET
jgi:hypothetical protein